jgi:hypothetical protein
LFIYLFIYDLALALAVMNSSDEDNNSATFAGMSTSPNIRLSSNHIVTAKNDASLLWASPNLVRTAQNIVSVVTATKAENSDYMNLPESTYEDTSGESMC